MKSIFHFCFKVEVFDGWMFDFFLFLFYKFEPTCILKGRWKVCSESIDFHHYLELFFPILLANPAICEAED